MRLAWGKCVSREFAGAAILVATDIGADPSDLMTCFAFETNKTFDPKKRNDSGSPAIGLIQFMPSTAAALGTTIEDLEKMTALDQLFFVRKYFRSNVGRLGTLEDLYMAILWPGAIGRPLDYVLFDRTDTDNPRRYAQNSLLDFDKDGKVTKFEATAWLRKYRQEGFKPENVLEVES